MKNKWGWYIIWPEDPTQTEWLGTCPKWIDSLRRAAARRGGTLKERRVMVVPSNAFCIECQKNH